MAVTDYEAKRILEDLRTHHAGPVYEWDTFTAKLERLLGDYAERRTIQAHMIRDVAKLAYGHIAEQLAQPQTERDAQVAKLEGVIERLEKRYAERGDTIRRLDAALEEKRSIHEARSKADDDQVEVTFTNGYKGWTVEQLEEIAYRLRLGGATDDTRVDITAHSAKGLVVDPTLVQLDVRRHDTAPQPLRVDPPGNDRTPDGLPHAPWMPGRLAVLGAALAAVATLIVRWLG